MKDSENPQRGKEAGSQRLNGIKVDVDNTESTWLIRCYVGQVREVEIILFLHDRLIFEGYSLCNIRPMGGDLMIAGKLSIKIAQEEYFIRVCEEWFGDPMLSPGTTGENIGANFKEGEDSQSLRRKEVDGLSPMKISRTTIALTSEFSVDPAPQ
ncbi:hypothetical protein Ancab_028270 [Ancistrocladus abbreviatus]